jgi:hypothetical protein
MTDREPRGTPASSVPGPSDDAPARRRAKSPDHRPTWLVLLSALTLLYGGRMLVGGLTVMRDPRAAIPVPVSASLTPAQDAIVRQFDDVRTRVAADHGRALRGDALVSIAEALALLFAAASTLSRDRRGRAVVLSVAWTGIAYQFGVLWLTYPVFRDLATVGGPLWSQLVSLEASPAQAKELTPEFLTSVIRTIPVVTTTLGILGSVILIGTFGGRRGRILYGLERAPGVGAAPR